MSTRVDVAIDFSNHGAQRGSCWTPARPCGVPCVVCTTGYTDEELVRMERFVRSARLGVVYAPNVTLGINVLMSVC